jgi:hypothetical protein
MQLVADNFHFEFKNTHWVKKLFQLSQKFEDDCLQYAFTKLILITREEWNKTYPYYACPPIADWIKFFESRKREESIKTRAEANLKASKKARLEGFKKTAFETFHNNPEKAQKFLDYLLSQNGELPSLY